MVTPEIFTVIPPPIEKTSTALFPLIATLAAPGPLMVRLVLIVSVLARVMVAGDARLKLMVSPETAFAIASRSEPKPLSLVFVTVRLVPTTLAVDEVCCCAAAS